MPKYKLIISYDGTAYGGWQSQHNSTSIQSVIEEALSLILRVSCKITGSGRTDAGVHALGQVAHFSSQDAIDEKKVLHSLNALLPKDIRALSLCLIEESFHARYSAIGKIYQYFIHLSDVEDPFQRRYALHIKHKINLEELSLAARYLIGTHDFSSFANEQHQGSAGKNAVRTLQRIEIIPTAHGICLEFEGTGFLYKMVRNITGTLLEIAAGKRDKDTLLGILAAKDRRLAGKAADPHALFLTKVLYNH
jgi:tRNA pseudouridine38-40 synthase